MGYAYNILDNWAIELDIEWTGWSSFKEINISYSEADPERSAVLNSDNPTPKQWKDVYSFAAGTEYILDNNIALRCGYFFFDSPVPDNTFDPFLPDSDVNGIAFGIGYPYKSLIIDFAFQGLFIETRNIDNDVGLSNGGSVDGRYSSFFYGFSLNLTYIFF